MATLFKITNGPCKGDLKLALFEWKVVKFTIDKLGEREIRIVQVGEGDGLNWWRIWGYMVEGIPYRLSPEGSCEGFFHSRTREGTLKIEWSELGTSLACPHCGKEQEWSCSNPNWHRGVKHRPSYCRNCGVELRLPK